MATQDMLRVFAGSCSGSLSARLAIQATSYSIPRVRRWRTTPPVQYHGGRSRYGGALLVLLNGRRRRAILVLQPVHATVHQAARIEQMLRPDVALRPAAAFR